MMKTNAPKSAGAFTLPELLVVVAVLGILAALLLPDLAKKKDISLRISCVSRHKSIGNSFRVFATDNGDRFPLQVGTNDFGMLSSKVTYRTPGPRPRGSTNAYIVLSGATGSQANSTSAAAWQVAQSIWYQEQSPKSFLCPSDSERSTSRRVTDFAGLAGAPGIMTTSSLGHAGNQNNAVSYAFGVAADESRPMGVLVVDRNVSNVGLAGANLASNVAPTSTRAVMHGKPGTTQVAYLMGTRMHGLKGNLAFADGSVVQATAEVLRSSFENAAKYYTAITNQNELLFP